MYQFINEFEVLTADQQERVHALTLEVLERKGVLFHNEEALGILKKWGARVDGNCVLFRAEQIDAAIRECPARFYWQARDDTKSLLVGAGQRGCYVMQDHGPVYIQQTDRKRRHGTLEDVINFYKLGQTSQITTIVGQCTVDPHELDENPAKHKIITNELLKHTDKPIMSWPQMESSQTRDIFRMVEIVMGDGYLDNHYFLTASVCALSPLQYGTASAQTIIDYARANQPVMLLTAPMNGVSAPIGDIASLVMQNAEILSGLALAQAVRPGIPVIYGIGSYVSDLRTGCFVTGSPESNLINRAALQLAQNLYHLPTRFMAGNTDAKVADIQAGYETMQNYIPLLFGGVQMINECLGILDGMVSVSYEKYILDEEILERIAIMMMGLDTSATAFNIDSLIDNPHGETFLTDEKTLAACGKQWTPQVAYRNNFSAWESEGYPDILDKAAAICAERIASAPKDLLDRDVSAMLEKYVQKQTA